MPLALDTDLPSFPRRFERASGHRIDELAPWVVADQLSTGLYRQAAVGSCQPDSTGTFTAYRVAVLLY